MLRQLASYPFECLPARYSVACHYALYAQLDGSSDTHDKVERHPLVESAVEENGTLEPFDG